MEWGIPSPLHTLPSSVRQRAVATVDVVDRVGASYTQWEQTRTNNHYNPRPPLTTILRNQSTTKRIFLLQHLQGPSVSSADLSRRAYESARRARRGSRLQYHWDSLRRHSAHGTADTLASIFSLMLKHTFPSPTWTLPSLIWGGNLNLEWIKYLQSWTVGKYQTCKTPQNDQEQGLLHFPIRQH